MIRLYPFERANFGKTSREDVDKFRTEISAAWKTFDPATSETSISADFKDLEGNEYMSLRLAPTACFERAGERYFTDGTFLINLEECFTFLEMILAAHENTDYPRDLISAEYFHDNS